MDVTDIIEPLNDAQRAAVTAEEVPTLVLAGAGSGKTRVLVHRAAWLIDVERVSPHGLMAATFTNKAGSTSSEWSFKQSLFQNLEPVIVLYLIGFMYLLFSKL